MASSAAASSPPSPSWTRLERSGQSLLRSWPFFISRRADDRRTTPRQGPRSDSRDSVATIVQAPLAPSPDLTSDDNVLLVLRVDPGERVHETTKGQGPKDPRASWALL